MQEAPKKRGEDYGNPARAGDAREEGNRKQTECELLVHGGQQTDGDAGDPRETCVYRVRVIYVGGGPGAVVRGDDVKRDDETDVRGSKGNADHGGREKFLRPDAAP